MDFHGLLHISILFTWVPACGGEDLGRSFWSVSTHQYVVAYSSWASARSDMDCVRMCDQVFQCVSCAYETGSKVCYLLPSVTALPTTLGTPVVTYSREAPKFNTLCQKSDAPSIQHGQVTSWRRSLTSLEGEVICDEDYIFTGRDATVRCVETRHWLGPEGRCLQTKWRPGLIQTSLAVSIPDKVGVGWSMCLEATPIRKRRIVCQRTENPFALHHISQALRRRVIPLSMPQSPRMIPVRRRGPQVRASMYVLRLHRVVLNLKTGSGLVALHVDMRFNAVGYTDTILLDSNFGGRWGWMTDAVKLDPFPVSVGVPYTLTITVLTETSVQIRINGRAGQWSAPTRRLPTRAEDVTQVVISGDVSVAVLDVWCQGQSGRVM